MSIRTTVHGFPKIGPDRELKKAVEGYWKKNLDAAALESEIERIKSKRFKSIQAANADLVPSNDFSVYDFVLDTSAMFGVVPERFKWTGGPVSRDICFAMARGTSDAIACELTKWFDTNYHYIVPEFTGEFEVTENKPLQAYRAAKASSNVDTKPVMLGPLTYIALGKVFDPNTKGFVKTTESKQFSELLLNVAKCYRQILHELEKEGVKTVQLDEPYLVMDLNKDEIEDLMGAYNVMREGLSTLDIHVQTFYEGVSQFEEVVKQLPVQGIGLDFVVNNDNLSHIQKIGFPGDKVLIAGVIDGRGIWKTDFQKISGLVDQLLKHVDQDRLILSNAAPLFHLPVSTIPESDHLNPKVLAHLAFAEERLEELKVLKEVVNGRKTAPESHLASLQDAFSNANVASQINRIDESSVGRSTPFRSRYEKQMAVLDLPLFPTTTIGSFPQTPELRKERAAWKAGKVSDADYKTFIQEYIQKVTAWQEDLGLDVLVHGEPERTDMVEFFGQKLDGFAFTKKGWVQSYGSRCVRPPIIYGDVSRSEPMTIDETLYAQSLTKKPMKGMLTGAVTILNWSFYRKDLPKKTIAYQIALALKEEVLDLEKAGIKVIQIDEPAFREGLPLKKAKQKAYLDWAVIAFKLTHDTVLDETQVHTHMCYSEFNEIIQAIQAMDADVISIEASRSKGEILDVFERDKYSLGVGLGVYDIHSPRVPEAEEMQAIVERSVKILDKELVWINPDCGLKTRGFEETEASLKNMVAVAGKMRSKYKQQTIQAVLTESGI